MSIDVLLPAALAFIMFSVGLALRGEDFRRVFQAPRALLIGLCGQLLIVPLAALAVVLVFKLPPALGVGLMILAACPGGASSGFLTHVARGNAALSLTLTVISSLAALATFPVLVKLVLTGLGSGGTVGSELNGGIGLLAELPVGRLIGSVLVVTTLPILTGMLMRNKAPRFTAPGTLMPSSKPLITPAAKPSPAPTVSTTSTLGHGYPSAWHAALRKPTSKRALCATRTASPSSA